MKCRLPKDTEVWIGKGMDACVVGWVHLDDACVVVRSGHAIDYLNLMMDGLWDQSDLLERYPDLDGNFYYYEPLNYLCLVEQLVAEGTIR